MPRRRGNTQPTHLRGYNYRHQQERKQWQPKVEAGNTHCHATPCWQPTTWIQPGTPWDLGHNDQRTGWTGPEHAHCNRKNGGRRAHTRPVVASRAW